MMRTCILLQATPPHSGPEAFASDSRSNEGSYNDLDEAEPSSSSLIPMGGTRCEIYKDPQSVRSYVLHNLKYLHYSSENVLCPTELIEETWSERPRTRLGDPSRLNQGTSNDVGGTERDRPKQNRNHQTTTLKMKVRILFLDMTYLYAFVIHVCTMYFLTLWLQFVYNLIGN